MILSTLDKSRKGGAYEQIPSLVLGQRWTPQLNSRNMMKVVLCVWIEPYIETDLSFCVWPVHTPTTSKEVLTLSASTSPLPYTGNKSCIVNTILSVMPKHTVYIDPCMGSAEVFFRKPRAEKEILNDYNGDLVNLFRVIQNNEKLAYLLGRLYLSINGELAFKQNKDRLKGVPNILDDVIETSQIFYDASWEDIQNAAAFLENQVYSFSSTGQTFGIARRDMSQRLPRLMSAYNRIRDAIILHRDYKDVITYAACPGSFILLDPPYKGTEDMYSKANFDIEQHDILFSFMSEVNQQHHGEVKFLITYNNGPYIRGLAEKHGFDTFVQTRLHSMKQSKEAGALYTKQSGSRFYMRQFVCECLNCGLKKTRQFKEEPYPEYGEVFVAHCKVCDSDQNHTRVLTRKTQAELRRRQEEEDLKKSISDQCARHGFTCRFLYQSVIITTPLADWCFDYHEKYKTLYHENTPNTKYLTGHYVKAHTQFNGKKMTVSAVIEYIASHEGWRAEQRSKTTKEKSE